MHPEARLDAKTIAHLYQSLRDKLLKLPDGTLVYPAHGAGSLYGKQHSSDTVSALGEQRRLNYALQPNIPLNHLEERIAEVPRDRRIALHCAGGYRTRSRPASCITTGSPI